MLEFVICEDSKEYLEQLSQWVKSIIDENAIEGRLVLATPNPQEVSNIVSDNIGNVFLLDIDLNSTKTGLELAKQIRENSNRAYIIFITEHLEYVLQAFSVRPFDFLPKPTTQNKLKHCLLNINRDYNNITFSSEASVNYIVVKFSSCVYYIKKNEIVYIEKFGNKSTIHTIDNSISCYKSLEFFEVNLSDTKAFVRCHKSYLVNKTYFSEIRLSSMEIIFTTGHTCSIGRKYKKDLV